MSGSFNYYVLEGLGSSLYWSDVEEIHLEIHTMAGTTFTEHLVPKFHLISTTLQVHKLHPHPKGSKT